MGGRIDGKMKRLGGGKVERCVNLFLQKNAPLSGKMSRWGDGKVETKRG